MLNYIYIAIIAGIAIMVGYYKFTILNLEAKIVLLEKAAVVKTFSLNDYKRVIVKQNDATRALNNVLIIRENELAAWRQLRGCRY